MAGRKLKKHCRIMAWVEAQDAEFAAAIRDLCMEGQLSARPGSSGVTFLYPQDSVRKDIVDKAYSASPEGAVTLIEAHIIPTCLKTAAAFNARKIGSKARVLLVVDSASGGTVTLKGGAKLAVAKDFAPLRKDNIAVWRVESGKVPDSGEAFDPATLRGKRGGADDVPNANIMRADIMKPIEQAYLGAEGSVDPGARNDLVFLKHLLGLLDTLANPALGFQEDLIKVLATLDRNPLCLYLYVEPYKTSGPYFISDAAIQAWGGGQAEPENAADSLLKLFEKQVDVVRNVQSSANLDGDPTAAAIFANPGGLESAIATLQAQLKDTASALTADKVVGLYTTCISNNMIGPIQGVWPESVKQALGNGRKVWQDALRHCLRLFQAKVQSRAPDSDYISFENSFRVLVRETFPGNNYTQEVLDYWSGKGGADGGNVAASDKVWSALTFVNSGDFLYIPRSNNLVESKIGGAVGSPDLHPLKSPPWAGDAMSHQALLDKRAASAPVANGSNLLALTQ